VLYSPCDLLFLNFIVGELKMEKNMFIEILNCETDSIELINLNYISSIKTKYVKGTNKEIIMCSGEKIEINYITYRRIIEIVKPI